MTSPGRGKGSTFTDTEADTGKIDPRLVMFAKLAQIVDHFSPTDCVAFVELAESLVDMSAHDRALVFLFASRLAK